MKKLFIYLSFGLLTTISLFFIVICSMLFYFKNNSKRLGCLDKPETPYLMVHRGDTSVSQENTIKGGLSSIQKGYGIELDVNIIKSGEIVVFHDADALEKTGTDLNLNEASLEEFLNLRYLKTMFGRTYEIRESPSTLTDYLKEICELNPNVHLDFDLKFEATSQNIREITRVIDNSKCNCESSSAKYVFSYYRAQDLSTIKDTLKDISSKCSEKIVPIYYVNPGSSIYGEFFILKTRLYIELYNIDSVNIEYQIVKKHPYLLESLNNDGFCTSVYSNYYKNITEYDVNYYQMIDLDYSSLSQDTYNYNRITYILLFVILVAGCLAIVITIILLFITCKNKNIKNDDKNVKYYTKSNKVFPSTNLREEDSQLNKNIIKNSCSNSNSQKENYYLEVKSTQ